MTSTAVVPSLLAISVSLAIVLPGSAQDPFEAAADPFGAPQGQGEVTGPAAKESVPLLKQVLASESEHDGIEAAASAGKLSERIWTVRLSWMVVVEGRVEKDTVCRLGC